MEIKRLLKKTVDILNQYDSGQNGTWQTLSREIENQATIKKADIKNFIKCNYVSDIYENGEIILQENFEFMNLRDVVKLIKEDVENFCRFLHFQGIIIK